MKIKPTTKDNQKVQGIKDSVSFGIKESGFAHIFNVLRNQLYSDKILAVVREYTCNAVDANVAAGKSETPIVVTLPNRMNPNFSVRDNGDALTDEDIHNIYAFYGESTKRNTNDQIGMLGIGSKAAFAYGDNFVINSFLDGKKHSYNAFIDPSQIGQISKLDVSDTDEENGIEIVVPVRDADVDEFVSKSKKLFNYFPVKPVIKGFADFEYNENEILFSGNGWEWKKLSEHSHDDNPVVIMGNIAYPFSRYDLNLDYNHDISNLIQDNVVLKFDIGDLEISASREKLQFTDSTKKAIIDRLELVEEEILSEITKEFDGCKTLFSAKTLYGSIMEDFTSGLYDFRDILSKKLEWNGKKVDNSQYRFSYDEVNTDDGKVKLNRYKKPNRGFKYRSEKEWTINCDENVVVVKNDIGHANGMLGRILPLAIDQKKKVYMITFASKKDEKDFLKEHNLDCELILASTLEKKKISDYYSTNTTSTNTNSSAASSSKHMTAAFELDWETIKENSTGSSWYRNKTKSAYFDCVEVDVENDSGVYVEIDRFNVTGANGSDIAPWEMQDIKRSFSKLGLSVPEQVYAFKKKAANKAVENENMINFWDFLMKQIEDIIESEDLVQRLVDHNHAINHWNSSNSRWLSNEVINEDEIVDKNGVMGTLFEAVLSMREEDEEERIKFSSLTHTCHNVFGFDKAQEILNKDTQPSFDLAAMIEEVRETYPMLDVVDSWRIEEHREKLTDYVNLVDSKI